MQSTRTNRQALDRLRTPESVLGVCLVVAALGFLAYTLPLSAAAAAWPRTVLVLLLLLGVAITVRGARAAAAPRSDGEAEWSRPVLRGPALTLLIVLAYVGLVGLVGFFPATAAYLLGHLWFGGVRDLRVLGGVAAGFVALVYLLFVYELQVPLPTGLLFG